MSSVPSTLSPETTIAELVTQYPASLAAFEKLGIDYCCGGRRPVRDAIADKGLDWPAVAAAIDAASAAASPADTRDWTGAPLSELAAHIVERYHAGLREILPRLDAMGQKVIAAHGERHAEVKDVASVFAGLRAELESHMMKEEHVLFPFIERLEAGTGRTHPMIGHIASPIGVMEHEHDSAGAALAELRALTGGYVAPLDACNTFRGYYDGLATLERDLHQHIHLENNILFPRAEALEARVMGTT